MELITPEICERIISQHFHGIYRSFQLEPIAGERKGALGEYYHLNIETDEGRHIFFLKTVLRNPNRPQFTNFVKSKESEFYTEVERLKQVIPELDLDFMPRCYLQDDSFFVLENIEGDSYESLDSENVDLVLRQLAKLHAFSFVWEMRNKRKLANESFVREALFATETDFVGSNYVSGVIDGINRLLIFEKFDESLIANFKTIHEIALEAFNSNIRDFKTVDANISNFKKCNLNVNDFKKVCCHGDLWANNILYLKNEASCKLIDYQMIRYQPPAHDLNMLIFLNCSTKTIQNNLDNFTTNYYKYLGEELQKHNIKLEGVLSKAEYEASCRYYWNISKFVRMYYKAFKCATRKRRVLKVMKPLDLVMKENDANFIVDMMNSDAGLKCEILEVLNDFRMVLKYPEFPPEFCFRILNRFIDDYDLVDYDFYNYCGRKSENLLDECVAFKVRLNGSEDFVLIDLPIFISHGCVLKVNVLIHGNIEECKISFEKV